MQKIVQLEQLSTHTALTVASDERISFVPACCKLFGVRHHRGCTSLMHARVGNQARVDSGSETFVSNAFKLTMVANAENIWQGCGQLSACWQNLHQFKRNSFCDWVPLQRNFWWRWVYTWCQPHLAFSGRSANPWSKMGKNSWLRCWAILWYSHCVPYVPPPQWIWWNFVKGVVLGTQTNINKPVAAGRSRQKLRLLRQFKDSACHQPSPLSTI